MIPVVNIYVSEHSTGKSCLEDSGQYQEFKGVMAESFCLQELVALLDEVPFYWASGNQAEVDFVASINNKIVPIEVKAAENVKARSLAEYSAEGDTSRLYL